jgi:heme exporter protein D
MNWGGVNEFFAMGGYGLFVWGSYGMMLLAVVIELLTLAARRDSARVRR